MREHGGCASFGLCGGFFRNPESGVVVARKGLSCRKSEALIAVQGEGERGMGRVGLLRRLVKMGGGC